MDRVIERWPKLTAELRAALVAAGELELAESVDGLLFAGRCSCKDDFCQTIRTSASVQHPFGPGQRCLALTSPWPGELMVDVMDDEIVQVEILFRRTLD